MYLSCFRLHVNCINVLLMKWKTYENCVNVMETFALYYCLMHVFHTFIHFSLGVCVTHMFQQQGRRQRRWNTKKKEKRYLWLLDKLMINDCSWLTNNNIVRCGANMSEWGISSSFLCVSHRCRIARVTAGKI